jgi:cytoskeletal protein CcmA (bactofilin family)
MVTRIDRSGILKGKIDSREDILIEGRFEGEISTTEKITVAKGGYVKGPLKCKTIEIAGIVEGDVESTESTKVYSFGKIHGDLITGHLFVEDGGILGGKVTTKERSTLTLDSQNKK